MVLLRKLLFWLLLFISPAAVRGAGSASAQKGGKPSDEVVDMDKFVVTAARYHWRYAKSEHFEILSSYANDDFVARVVQVAELLIKTYEKNLPIFRSNCELPAKLIVIENNGIERFFTAIGETANPDRKSIRGGPIPVWSESVLNAEQIIMICTITRQVVNSPIPLEQQAARYATNLASRYRERCLNGKKISISNGGDFLWFNSTSYAPNINKNTITHERFYQSAEIQWIKDWAKNDYENKLSNPDYGRRWGNTLPLDKPLFNLRDIVESAKPFFLQFPAPGSSVEDVQKFISFHRQMYDFSYYCAFGPNPETRGAFENLMKYRTKQLPITEEIFKRYFGKNYEEFSNEMDNFYRESAKGTPYQDSAWGNPTMVIDHFDPQKIPKIAWTDATRSQSARIISDWFFLNKHPDIARQTLDLAITDAYYVRNDPEFCAAWGLSEMQYGDKATALTLLEKAASAKVARPEVYRSLSRMYLQNILVSKGRDYKLDSTELQKVLAPLSVALKLSQSNPQTCWQMLELTQHTNESYPRELWNTIVNNCIQQFPDNFALLNQLVPLLLKNGLKDEATSLLDATEKCPLTEREQQQLARLKTIVGGQN